MDRAIELIELALNSLDGPEAIPDELKQHFYRCCSRPWLTTNSSGRTRQPDGVAWVEDEFGYLWEVGKPLPDAIIEEIRSNQSVDLARVPLVPFLIKHLLGPALARVEGNLAEQVGATFGLTRNA